MIESVQWIKRTCTLTVYCKLLKRFRLEMRKFSFSNRVIDNWDSLSAPCVNSGTINMFEKHASVELESYTVN